jgi:hypothetical protein
MGPVTIIFGMVLTFLGLRGWVGDETSRPWGATPLFVGVPLLLLGVLALSARLRMHAMHLAAMAGLVGIVLGAWGLMRGGGAAAGVATSTQAIMTVLCAAFVGLCVSSFIRARRRRRAAEQAAQAR